MGSFFYNTNGFAFHRLEDAVRASGDTARVAEFNSRREEMRAMEVQYDQLIDELGVMDSGLSDEDRIILRVARMFGECELDIPDGFVREVKTYIEKWKATGRLKQALARLKRDDLAPIISAAMLDDYKGRALKCLTRLENPTLKGLLRRVLCKIFDDIEKMRCCDDHKAKHD